MNEKLSYRDLKTMIHQYEDRKNNVTKWIFNIISYKDLKEEDIKELHNIFLKVMNDHYKTIEDLEQLNDNIIRKFNKYDDREL